MIVRERYRPRHGSRNAGPHLRALLHHQGRRQGHRPWTGHLLRNHQAERRVHLVYSEPGSGTASASIFPASRAHPTLAANSRIPNPPSADRKPFFSSKMKIPFASWFAKPFNPAAIACSKPTMEVSFRLTSSYPEQIHLGHHRRCYARPQRPRTHRSRPAHAPTA